VLTEELDHRILSHLNDMGSTEDKAFWFLNYLGQLLKETSLFGLIPMPTAPPETEGHTIAGVSGQVVSLTTGRMANNDVAINLKAVLSSFCIHSEVLGWR